MPLSRRWSKYRRRFTGPPTSPSLACWGWQMFADQTKISVHLRLSAAKRASARFSSGCSLFIVTMNMERCFPSHEKDLFQTATDKPVLICGILFCPKCATNATAAINAVSTAAGPVAASLAHLTSRAAAETPGHAQPQSRRNRTGRAGRKSAPDHSGRSQRALSLGR